MKKTHPTPSTEGIDLCDVQRRLGSWYDEHARALPWREDVSAYHVMLSEIILQQTRVDQGMAYYHRFTERFPTVQDLAAASEDEVLLLWQGLGYYSRGRNLLRAAQIIVSDFGGEIPHSPEGLSRLPGVGPYTRGAILSFAYNLPYPTVDGTGVRDYIHVVDLADGHLKAVDYITEHGGLHTWNLGTGNGYSVLEVLHAFEKACGKELPYKIVARRPGDFPPAQDRLRRVRTAASLRPR